MAEAWSGPRVRLLLDHADKIVHYVVGKSDWFLVPIGAIAAVLESGDID
jgi:hypothetical protein